MLFSYCAECLTSCNLFIATNQVGSVRECPGKGALHTWPSKFSQAVVITLILTWKEIQKDCLTCLRLYSP